MSIHAAAPRIGGSCIRGFLWALIFEAISLAMLAVVVFGIYTLQH